jgi:hypothetical protein
MTYGKLHITPPSTFREQKAALQDLLAKGEIDQALYASKLRDLDRDFLRFIAASNAYNPPAGKKGREKYSEWSNKMQKQQSKEIVERVNQGMDQAQNDPSINNSGQIEILTNSEQSGTKSSTAEEQ